MLEIRPFRAGDEHALVLILNAIIAAGGTTAYETPFTADRLRAYHLDGPSVLCCHVALEQGVPVGFQVLNANPALPPAWGDIASFTRRDPPVRGAGTALFAATRTRARALGIVAINATIRADNVPGLAYYARVGFVDYGAFRAVPLADGTRVDRIRRKLVV